MPPQETQIAAPQMTQRQPTPQPAAPTPLYQSECWHIPKGNFGLFGYRKCLVVLYPGWLIVYRQSNHQEVQRIQLTHDVQLKAFLGFSRISFIGGQKISFFKQNFGYAFSSLWGYGLIFAGVLINLFQDLVIYNASVQGDVVTSASRLPGEGLELIFLIVGLVWLWRGSPKAKAFVQACKHAAGVA